MDRKRMFEAKERYVEKVMDENSEIDTLTEEEHDVLRELCRFRHELHTNQESIFNLNDDGLTDKFNEFAEENNLPFCIDYDDLITTLDYDILTEPEKEEYEKQAEEYNNSKSENAWSHSGYTLWREDNFGKCYDYLEDLNNQIESYLREIDEKYGTHYAPTGWARLNSV